MIENNEVLNDTQEEITLLTEVKAVLKAELSENVFEKYIMNLKQDCFIGDFICFTCPEEMLDIITARYEQLLKAACRDVVGGGDISIMIMPDYESMDGCPF